MRRTLLILLSGLGCLWAQDAREIVKRSVAQDSLNWNRAGNYNWVQRVEQRKLDADGKVQSVETRTYDMSVYGGQMVSKLVAKDDRPLSADEQQRAQAKFLKEVRETQDANRQEKNHRQRFMLEVPDAFNWRLTGETVVSGRPVWIVEGDPNPNHQFADSMAGRILPKMKGKLWIDKTEYQWVKAEAEVIAPVSIGLFIARLAPGTKFFGQQTRVNGEVWLPQQMNLRFDARVALVKRMDEEVVVTCKEYKKFQSDARLVKSGAVAAP